MPPNACPIPKKNQPINCKSCPFPPLERIKKCNYYKGQIKSGVPWFLKADKYWYNKGEYFFRE